MEDAFPSCSPVAYVVMLSLIVSPRLTFTRMDAVLACTPCFRYLLRVQFGCRISCSSTEARWSDDAAWTYREALLSGKYTD